MIGSFTRFFLALGAAALVPLSPSAAAEPLRMAQLAPATGGEAQPETALPPIPEGWKRVSRQGVSIAVPKDWSADEDRDDHLGFFRGDKSQLQGMAVIVGLQSQNEIDEFESQVTNIFKTMKEKLNISDEDGTPRIWDSDPIPSGSGTTIRHKHAEMQTSTAAFIFDLAFEDIADAEKVRSAFIAVINMPPQEVAATIENLRATVSFANEVDAPVTAKPNTAMGGMVVFKGPVPPGWLIQLDRPDTLSFLVRPEASGYLVLRVDRRPETLASVFQGPPEVSRGEIFGVTGDLLEGEAVRNEVYSAGQLVRGHTRVYRLDICDASGAPFVVEMSATPAFWQARGFDDLIGVITLAPPADVSVCRHAGGYAGVNAPTVSSEPTAGSEDDSGTGEGCAGAECAPVPPAVDPADAALWDAVRDSDNPVLLRAYLENYPNGAFADQARARLAALAAGDEEDSAPSGTGGPDTATDNGAASAPDSDADAVADDGAGGDPFAQADDIMRAALKGESAGWDAAARRAVPLYRKAAAQGSGPALLALGGLRERGIGVDENRNLAIRLYRRAGRAGVFDGFARALGLLDELGRKKAYATVFLEAHASDPAAALALLEGASAPSIRALQVKLRREGLFGGKPNGRFGPKTAAALAARTPPAAAPGPAEGTENGGSEGYSALGAAIQRELLRVGCYAGPIDGDWSAETVQAVRNFNRFGPRKVAAKKPTKRARRTITAATAPVCGVD